MAFTRPEPLTLQHISAETFGSSKAAIHVIQLDSTGGIVSGGAGGGSTQVSIREILTSSGVSMVDSTETALRVNVVAGAAGGSTQVTVRQSSAADLNVTVAGYSTTVNVSSLAGFVDVTPAVPDATDYLPVRLTNGTTFTAPSTTVQVSSAGGRVLVDQNSTVWPVQVSSVAGRVAVAGFNATDGITNVTDSTNNAFRVNVVAGSAAGSTDVSVTQLRDSSGGSISAGDSANNAIRVNVVAGAAGGSTVMTVSTGSVRVHQSSAADLNVTVAGYSTTVNISSLAGAVITRSSAANMLVTAYQSTAADFQATVTPASTNWPVQVSTVAGRVLVDQNSTVWQTQASLRTSSGGALEGSTAAPAVGVLGLHTREVMPTLQSTRAVITSSNSTALYTLVSSAANPLRHKVYAYSLTSTETTPSTLVFYSSNTIDRWAVAFGSGSSGVTGANLALSPPAWLFHADANNALRCLIEKAASTQCIVTLSIGYFTEA
jgi:hypothetical protein